MITALRSGIIGTGFMGEVHAHAVRAAGGTVRAVASRTEAGAERAVLALGALHAAASPEALIERDDVNVVHICTPNAAHAWYAKLAIAAGKAVVCEKPLATSVEDAVGLVHRGDAGRLWLLHGSYLQDWLASPQATNWRVDPAAGGASRAFGDIGVHWCDLMEFVTGQRIARLVASTSQAFAERPGEGGSFPVATEDGATVLFETDHGAAGSVVVSQVTPGRKNRLWFSFNGTEPSLSFDQEQPDALWLGRADASTRVAVGPDTLTTEGGRRYARLPAGHPQGYQDSFNAFVADVYAAARGGTPEGLPTFADGLRAAQLTQAIITSAQEGGWVTVPLHKEPARQLSATI